MKEAFQIGPVTVRPPFLSAPMAGFTNGAFRSILRHFGGVGLIATEMISARAFVHRSAAGQSHPDRLWGVAEEPAPLSVQIWDNQPETLAETASRIAREYHPAVIDLNFGCPAPKIARNSASGSALLRDPQKVGDIVAMVASVTEGLPVTAKIRLGLTADTINAIDVAQAVEAAGGKALTVHGRTAAQMYRGEADWEEIGKVRPYLKAIPLIGNGDIRDPETAVARLRDTAVDGVMIGRAALSHPWIFSQAAALLRGEPLPPAPDRREERELIIGHYQLICQRFGPVKGTILMRKYAAEWSRGRDRGKLFRVAASGASTPEEFLEAIDQFFSGDAPPAAEADKQE